MEPEEPPPTFYYVPHNIFTRKDKHYAPAVHRDLPMCDAELGRPKIDMLKCYHLGCELTFSNGAALANHLTYNMAYNRGMVNRHEAAYKGINKLTAPKCEVCNINFKDIGQLVEHLARLGIDGYWKKGETYRTHIESIRKQNIAEKELFYGTKPASDPKFTLDVRTFPKVIETELCLVCEQLPSQVLYEGCKHLNVCYRCYKLLQARQTCIYCKTSSQQLFRVTPEFIAKLKS